MTATSSYCFGIVRGVYYLSVLIAILGLPLARSRSVPLDDDEIWLVDLEEKVRTNDFQADSASLAAAREPVATECPVVIEGFPGYDCAQAQCRSDADCPGHAQMCCSNGCVRTCINKSNRPLLVDWVLYPGRPPTGNTWLLSAPRETDETKGAYCTTSKTHEDSSPLLCPGDSICHIEDQGNPQKNIPNRGRCVPEKHLKSFDTKQYVRHDVTSSTESKTRICTMGSTVYAEDTRFYKDGRPCVCRDSVVTCYKRVAK